MKLLFDIETNGLLRETPSRRWNEETNKWEAIIIPQLDKAWCIVAIDENNKQYLFRPHQIKEGIELLKSADTLIGHNIIGFDLIVLQKWYGINLYEHCKIMDTLVLSLLFNPIREKGHSLKAWGEKLGYPKGDHTDFDKFSEEMLEYCIRDTKIVKKLSAELKKESAGFSKQSIFLEHETRRVICNQIENGFAFDYKKASMLLATLSQRKKEVEDRVKETFKAKETEHIIFPLETKKGEVSKRGKLFGTEKQVNLTEEEYDRFKTGCVTSVKRLLVTDFNLGSRKQIGEYLIEFGWKPNKFTPAGQPIVDEVTLEKIIHIPEAQLIAEFLLLQKRIGYVQSWMDAVAKEDNRIHGNVITNGAITSRMTHYNPNMTQIPSIHKPYGKECRECWTVDNGNVLLGIDASGLEVRMLAHYMKDKEYINEIINGDIHTSNQKLAGLESRDKAKTFIYALMYGAGDAKLGSVVGGNKKDGKRSRQYFFDNQPSFKSLRDRVQRAATKGHIKGLDERRIFIRNQHASLNSLLQGAGAIVMKKALTLFDETLQDLNMDYRFVANIHDEWQLEVPKNQADLIGKIGVDSIINAGKHFNMACPLDGEYKIGNNWNETH